MGHVERPGLVWITAPPTAHSDQLLKEVTLLFPSNPDSMLHGQVEMMSLEQWQGGENLTVGTLVAVRFSEDGLVYRAKVRNIKKKVWFKSSLRLFLLMVLG